MKYNKSIGEKRIGIYFDPILSQINRKCAEIINLCEDLKSIQRPDGFNYTDNPEAIRLISLAQTAFEEGAMRVKKATNL